MHAPRENNAMLAVNANTTARKRHVEGHESASHHHQASTVWKHHVSPHESIMEAPCMAVQERIISGGACLPLVT